jgi:hypothetical protein
MVLIAWPPVVAGQNILCQVSGHFLLGAVHFPSWVTCSLPLHGGRPAQPDPAAVESPRAQRPFPSHELPIVMTNCFFPNDLQFQEPA